MPMINIPIDVEFICIGRKSKQLFLVITRPLSNYKKFKINIPKEFAYVVITILLKMPSNWKTFCMKENNEMTC